MPRHSDAVRPASLKRRLLFTLSVCAILAMAGRSLVGDRGLFEVWRKKGTYQKLAVEVQGLRAENVKTEVVVADHRQSELRCQLAG